MVPLAQGAEEEVSTTTAEPAWLGRDCVRNDDGELVGDQSGVMHGTNKGSGRGPIRGLSGDQSGVGQGG